MMKWAYQLVRAEDSEKFLSSLNSLGSEGWEAVSGAYTIGEVKKVTLGQGMPPSMSVGVSMWTAVMKRSTSA